MTKYQTQTVSLRSAFRRFFKGVKDFFVKLPLKALAAIEPPSAY